MNKNATSDEVSKGCCDPSSEFELVAAVVAGDTDAYGTLVERYQDRLYHSLW